MNLAGCFLNKSAFATPYEKAFLTSVICCVIPVPNTCLSAGFICCFLLLALEDTVHYCSPFHSPQATRVFTDLYGMCTAFILRTLQTQPLPALLQSYTATPAADSKGSLDSFSPCLKFHYQIMSLTSSSTDRHSA